VEGPTLERHAPRAMRRALSAIERALPGMAGAALLASASPAAAAGGVGPGAYCPFPKAGEKPKCLEPATQEYGEFFTAIDGGGDRSEAAVARLERDVAEGAASEEPYLAISSLSYGYYRLAQQAAANPDEDPVIVARLERWNTLLSEAYARSADDENYRAAVRDAALDLRERAPAVTLDCVDEHGEVVGCTSTESVIRGFNRAGDQVGIRGALGRLLNRMFGDDDS